MKLQHYELQALLSTLSCKGGQWQITLPEEFDGLSKKAIVEKPVTLEDNNEENKNQI